MADLKETWADKTPTPTHKMLAKLWERGVLVRLYTQNIDGLEEKVMPCWPHPGWSASSEVDSPCITLHGRLTLTLCGKCSDIGSWSDDKTSEFRAGRAVECKKCRQYLLPPASLLLTVLEADPVTIQRAKSLPILAVLNGVTADRSLCGPESHIQYRWTTKLRHV